MGNNILANLFQAGLPNNRRSEGLSILNTIASATAASTTDSSDTSTTYSFSNTLTLPDLGEEPLSLSQFSTSSDLVFDLDSSFSVSNSAFLNALDEQGGFSDVQTQAVDQLLGNPALTERAETIYSMVEDMPRGDEVLTLLYAASEQNNKSLGSDKPALSNHQGEGMFPPSVDAALGLASDEDDPDVQINAFVAKAEQLLASNPEMSIGTLARELGVPTNRAALTNALEIVSATFDQNQPVEVASKAGGTAALSDELMPSQELHLAWNPASHEDDFTGLTDITPDEVIANRLTQGASSYFGTSTTAGPDGGNKACMWAVNNVLEQSLGITLGNDTNAVRTALADLQAGAGTEVSQSEARPGDIVIAPNIGHIGIVQEDGSVISNSSSRRSFRWVSNINFDGYYGSGQSTVWRLNPDMVVERSNSQDLLANLE